MPPSVVRPWSTQYGKDYNAKTSGWRKQKSVQIKVPVSYKRYGGAPAATSLVPPCKNMAYSGDYHGLDDPYGDDACVDTAADLGAITSARDVMNIQTQTEPVIPEPVELRTETPDPTRQLHWICWPEPKKSKQTRPHTSQGFHSSTDAVPEVYATRNDNLPHPGNTLLYQPEINSWTNAENGNERQSVNMMLTSLRRSHTYYEPTWKPMTSISINDPPIRDSYTLYGGKSVDPSGIYKQSFFPYHKPGGAGPREDMVLQGISRSMEGKEPTPYRNTLSFNKYPLHMRRGKMPSSKSQDYVHDQSMFMTTTPKCVGHFIIHPDWVSERGGLRRSNTTILQHSRSRNEQLRY